MRPFLRSLIGTLAAVGCSRTPPPSGDPPSSKVAPKTIGSVASAPAPGSSAALPAGATACPAGPASGPACLRFATPEEAFRWVLTQEALVLAVGESHAPKGMDHVASSTKRFTETLLPVVAPRASDVVVELWAPDPKCMKEVKQVASAQKPVTDVQAPTNQNEYVTLGTKAKEAGMTPWLLRPTCDDFALLADAGADAVGASLGLIKRLTQTKVTQLYERNAREARGHAPSHPKTVVTYGGALHNDLAPSEAMKEYSFGPELDHATGGRYVELDLIVPEFVQKRAPWDKLPWYPAFQVEEESGAPRDKATLYVLGERSFVLVFPETSRSPG